MRTNSAVSDPHIPALPDNDVLRSLEEISCKLLREAALALACGNRHAAVAPLSYGVACRFHAGRLGGRNRSAEALLSDTIRTADEEVAFWSGRGLEKGIIHSCSSAEAGRRLRLAGRNVGEGRRLFWLGYLHAEHWDNRAALAVFKKLAEHCAHPRVLHWTGNLLAKCGQFDAACPFLEKAAEREPARYNHFSHLGNVYRGLHRGSEAERCYRHAIGLIRRGVIGRVEYIHLVRCAQGLAALGCAGYDEHTQALCREAAAAGLVQQHELDRIMF